MICICMYVHDTFFHTYIHTYTYIRTCVCVLCLFVCMYVFFFASYVFCVRLVLCVCLCGVWKPQLPSVGFRWKTTMENTTPTAEIHILCTHACIFSAHSILWIVSQAQVCRNSGFPMWSSWTSLSLVLGQLPSPPHFRPFCPCCMDNGFSSVDLLCRANSWWESRRQFPFFSSLSVSLSLQNALNMVHTYIHSALALHAWVLSTMASAKMGSAQHKGLPDFIYSKNEVKHSVSGTACIS